jgi:hypothetical protein
LFFQLTSANPNESTTTRWLIEDMPELPEIVVAEGIRLRLLARCLQRTRIDSDVTPPRRLQEATS